MPTLETKESTRRIEKIGKWPIAIVTVKIGDTCHCKAQIDLPGAGARIAEASASDAKTAEDKVLAEVKRLLKV